MSCLISSILQRVSLWQRTLLCRRKEKERETPNVLIESIVANLGGERANLILWSRKTMIASLIQFPSQCCKGWCREREREKEKKREGPNESNSKSQEIPPSGARIASQSLFLFFAIDFIQAKEHRVKYTMNPRSH